MAKLKEQLSRIKARIEAQDGTVIESVEGEVELDDQNEEGKPRRGPVLVLRSIEEGSQLKLARPRPIIVLGSISGQVFGAYTVKAGNLLSGRLEGCRHVEIVHNLGSKGSSNVDSWIVFEATSDPGFFSKAQHHLERLQRLEKEQIPQREATARTVLMNSLKNAPFAAEVAIEQEAARQVVFALLPNGRIKMNLKVLLRHLITWSESASRSADDKSEIDRFKAALDETISQSLQRATRNGIGAKLRRARGEDMYQPYVEIIAEYLLPKLLKLWMETGELYVQKVVDRLTGAPMVLKVDGQLAPFFQIEYPRWRTYVVGGRIEFEKIADCNIACQLGSSGKTMNLTYTYASEDDWITQTREIDLREGKACKLILQNGNVFLTDASRQLFGPDMEKD